MNQNNTNNDQKIDYKGVTRWGKLVEKTISEEGGKIQNLKRASFKPRFLFKPSRIHFDAVVGEGEVKKIVRMSVKCRDVAKKMGIESEQLKELIEKKNFSFERTFLRDLHKDRSFHKGKPVQSSLTVGDIHAVERGESENDQCAFGRVETTSKTDIHQKNGPRNDDHVSFRQLDNGVGIIVETDGAGSGGKASELFSYYLNQSINASMSMTSEYFLKLTAQIANEKNTEQKDALKDQLKETVQTLAIDAVQDAINETTNHLKGDEGVANGATTLSLLVSVPLPNGNSMTFGLQNADSVSALWNPETGQFEEDSCRTKEDLSLISMRVDAKENILGKKLRSGRVEKESEFFINEIEGKRIAIAFSDGVWDNLPGESNQDKLEVLKHIILNPEFDQPGDDIQPEPGFVLTKDKIYNVASGGNEDFPIDITPAIMRNRIMNFTVWATKNIRERQSAVDDFIEKWKGPDVDPITGSRNPHSAKISKDVEINEDEYLALPEEARNHATKTLENTYKFTNDTVVELWCIDLENVDESDIERFKQHIKVLRHDTNYQKLYFYGGSNIGLEFLERQKNKEIEAHPEAVSPKTDGVSVVAMSIDNPPIDQMQKFFSLYGANQRGVSYAPEANMENLTTYIETDDFKRHCKATKVYYNANQLELEDAKQIVSHREPVNIEMERGYDTNKMKNLYGYDQSVYNDTAIKKQDGNAFADMPNTAAIYTEAYLWDPPGGNEKKEVAVIHIPAPALDTPKQPHYNYYVKNGRLDTDKYEEEMAHLARTIVQAAVDNKNSAFGGEGLQRLVISRYGQGNFLNALSPEDRKKANEIYYRTLANEINKKKDDLEGLQIAISARNQSDVDDGMENFAKILRGLGFELKALKFEKKSIIIGDIKEIASDRDLIVNAWDPHSAIGNGNDADNSFDGQIGRSTSSVLAGTPQINPLLYKDDAYVPVGEPQTEESF